MDDEDDDFLPGIDDYLEHTHNSKSVSSYNLEELILTIQSKTGLDKDICALIIESFFQEIRNIMMNGNMVKFIKFGRFFISSPKTTNARNRVEAKFKPAKCILKEMNDKRS